MPIAAPVLHMRRTATEDCELAARLTGEDIISDSLGGARDVQLSDDGWRLSRWRQFVRSYSLPSLPDPIFVVHIAGKPQVRTWQRDSWSESPVAPPSCPPGTSPTFSNRRPGTAPIAMC